MYCIKFEKTSFDFQEKDTKTELTIMQGNRGNYLKYKGQFLYTLNQVQAKKNKKQFTSTTNRYATLTTMIYNI